MRLGREFHPHRVARTDGPARDDDRHHAGASLDRPVVVRPDDGFEQPLLEAIDLNTRIAESRDLDGRLVAQVEDRSAGKAEEVDALRRHVLPQVPRLDRVALPGELVEELTVDEMHLPKVRFVLVPTLPGEVLHGSAGVRVTLDTEPLDEDDLRDRPLTEVVTPVEVDGDDGGGGSGSGHGSILPALHRRPIHPRIQPWSDAEPRFECDSEYMNTSVKRWVPFASVPLIAVAAAIAIPMTTNAAQDLPEKTPQQLLEFVADSDVTAFSGEFTQTSDLGLPDLSSLGSGSTTGVDGDSIVGALVELATASHDARVYVDADEGARLQVLDRLDERDVIATADDGLWIYDSGAKSATHVTSTGGSDAPDSSTPSEIPTPSSVAEKLLDSLDDTTTVAVGSNGTVAGRSAYELVLTPRADDSLVGDVTISIDGETGMPLGIDVTADGASTPAFSVAYTSLDLSTPDASLFSFTPPAGTDVTEKAIPADGHAGGTAPDGTAPDGSGMESAPDVTTTGTGWSTIVELAAGDAPAALDGLDTITTPVDGGRVLSSSLVNVLITDDGRVFAGAVSVEALETAAG